MIALFAVIGAGCSIAFDRYKWKLMESSEAYKDELVIRHRQRLGQSLDLSQ